MAASRKFAKQPNLNSGQYIITYCILQIIQGGKVSWLHNSLENIRGWTVVLHGQILLHWLFYWKSFAVINQSTKTAKLFHLKRFAIYGTVQLNSNLTLVFDHSRVFTDFI